jgi:uncharacterized iron-regulated membrane protein
MTRRPYFVERALEDAGVELPASAAISRTSTSATEAAFWPLAIEEAVTLAQREIANLRVSGVSFTRGSASKITVRGQGDAWLVRDAANVVRIDPYHDRVEPSSRATDMAAVRRWVHTADPLHFGTFGGLTTRLIWFGAGLITSAAILLGVRVWYLRSLPARAALTRSRVLVSVSVTLIVLGLSVYGCVVNIGDAPPMSRLRHTRRSARTRLVRCPSTWPRRRMPDARPSAAALRSRIARTYGAGGHGWGTCAGLRRFRMAPCR